MHKSNKALVQLLVHNTPITTVDSQTQELKLHSNSLHPVAYIFLAASQKANADGPQSTKNVPVFLCQSKNAHFIYKILIY